MMAKPNSLTTMVPDATKPFAKLVDPICVDELRKDIELLDKEFFLARQGPLEVYLAPADRIPNVLLEIGRLRELTFRTVGEGTGRARDLDHHDPFYLHLFLWDREAGQIAGAYRLARTDEVLASHGVEGLYSASFCHYDPTLLDDLNPALELGRSWIRPDYQRSLHSLLGLWNGIGRFVARNPKYHRLFGAVCISADYSPTSQNLLVRYFRRTASDPRWAGRMTALVPFKEHPENLTPRMQSIDEISAEVARHEPDGKGVPVLLRQYLKLNATLLGFAIDPRFMDSLDAMVMVDLKEAPPRLLKKYMGEADFARFSS